MQIIGWMYKTKDKDTYRLQIEDVAAHWKVSPRTAYYTLQMLGSKGYLTIHYSRGWTYLKKGPRITDHNTSMPGEPVNANMPGELANTPGEPEHNTIHKSCATPLHETEPGATSLHSAPNNVVVDDLVSRVEKQQQQNTINATVQRHCVKRGFWAEVALELASDPWVTEQRVDCALAVFQDKKDRGIMIGGRAVGSVHALALSSLRSHIEQEMPENEEVRFRRRFIEGEYASYIEH